LFRNFENIDALNLEKKVYLKIQWRLQEIKKLKIDFDFPLPKKSAGMH